LLTALHLYPEILVLVLEVLVARMKMPYKPASMPSAEDRWMSSEN